MLSSSVSCKNFNVAHYSKSLKGINTKHGILAHQDKMQLKDKGHNSVAIVLKLVGWGLVSVAKWLGSLT